MSAQSDIQRILDRHLHDAGSGFSVGSFGAVAEFHRDAGEALTVDEPENLTIATDRGALRVGPTDMVKPLAYETLSQHDDRWQHAVAFCLPAPAAESNRRAILTELGPDRSAVRPADRDAVLFDVGLNARNMDFCVRTDDPELLRELRRGVGRSILEAGNAVMPTIVEASPHRVALTAIARAEVYQTIGRKRTPEGPHSHVLPKLLRAGRTHSANAPIPDGYVPGLTLHPANPLFDGLGRAKPFDSAAQAAFDRLLDLWGDSDYLAEKARALEAVERGVDPGAYVPARTRAGRTALRILLRQLRHRNGTPPGLDDWSRRFDRPPFGRAP